MDHAMHRNMCPRFLNHNLANNLQRAERDHRLHKTKEKYRKHRPSRSEHGTNQVKLRSVLAYHEI